MGAFSKTGISAAALTAAVSAGTLDRQRLYRREPLIGNLAEPIPGRKVRGRDVHLPGEAARHPQASPPSLIGRHNQDHRTPVFPTGDGPDVTGLPPSGPRVGMEAHQSDARDRRQACSVTGKRRLNEHRRLLVAGKIESHSVTIVVTRPGQLDDRIGSNGQRLQVRPDEHSCRDNCEQRDRGRASHYGSAQPPSTSTSYRSCSNHISHRSSPEHTANT